MAQGDVGGRSRVAPPEEVRAWIMGLKGPFVTERSMKLTPGSLSSSRFLATCQPDVLGADPLAEFRRIAQWLGCPEPAIARLTENWDRVLTVHIGYDGLDPALYKLYVEFPLGESGRSDLPPDTLFLAAKWLPDSQAYFSTYRHLPRPRTGREARAMMDRDDLPDIGSGARRFAARVLDELIVPDGQVDVMLVEDEGRPRRSYDINLYRVQTPLARHRGAIAELCRAYDLPGALGYVLEDGAGSNLGHVAVGRSAQGDEFVTLYYGFEQHVPR